MVAFVLPLLDRGEHRRNVPGFQAQFLGLGPDRVLAGELPDRCAAPVADYLGWDVLVGGWVLGDAVHVQPALVGEGAPADVRAVGVGRQVHQLRDVVR